MNRRDFLSLAAALPLTQRVFADTRAVHSRLVYPGRNDRLVYVADSSGNIVPDFSNCGYMGGGVVLPQIPVRAEVSALEGSATERIQAAIDKVSALPLKDRFRGAVLLKKGVYRVDGPLRITASGIVLRGEGQGEDGTVLVATRRERHSLIEIRGNGNIKLGGSCKIADKFIPVGARKFRVNSAKGLRVGDNIVVRRIGNAAWISEIKMDRIVPRPTGGTRQWEPFNLDFERVITAIDGERITVDAPIVCGLIDERWGGGEVLAADTAHRIRHVGIENLRGVSEFDRSITAEIGREKKKYFADEKHAWNLIDVDLAENVWVQNITALHFAYAAVSVSRAKWVTVKDCDSGEMVSVITGGLHYSYNIDGGQLCLFLRCRAQTGRHDFVVGARVPGPNVFVDCSATETYASSEPHHRWSVGGLFDNVKAPLAIQDRGYFGSGHGWSGANYVAWNCEGPLVCQKPPTAQNWAIGHVGEKVKGAFEPREDGHWESHGRHVEPRSLYVQQLKDRLGKRAAKNAGLA